jgi:hypothetical protein
MRGTKEKGRRGLTSAKAATILVVAIVAVGAVGYVILSSIGAGNTTTTSSCSPAKAPQCAGNAKSNEGYPSGPTVAIPLG